jgi:small subunit ribosomal protein S6
LVAYEILLMLDAGVAEPRQTEIVERIKSLVETGGGSWQSHVPWGKRRLAYEIAHKDEGIYHLLTFDAEPATVEEIGRVLRIDDDVMRHMAVRRIEGSSTAAPPVIAPEPVAAPVEQAPAPTPAAEAPAAAAPAAPASPAAEAVVEAADAPVSDADTAPAAASDSASESVQAAE